MTDLDDLIARLREPIIGDAHGDGLITSGRLAERLIRERGESAAALASLRDEVALWKALAVDRDGGSHDEDCSSRMQRGRPCTCGHDAIRAALKHQ